MKQFKNGLLVCFLFVTISSFSQQKKWTLEACISHALENNISIKQSALDTELAQENITNAKGNFLPSVNGSTSGNFNFGSFIGQDGSRISRNSFGNSLSINAGVTLFNGFRNTNLYKQAELGLESSRVQLQKLKDDISLFVVNSYLNALLSKENYKIAEEQVKVSEEQIENIKELVDAGVRPRSDLYNVQAELASNNERLITAQNGIDLALLNLSQLLQVTYKGFDIEDVNIDLSSVELLYNDSELIFKKAVGNRPEIRVAEIRIENSEMDIEIAKSAFYPTVSLGAGLGTSYQHTLGEKDRRTIVDPNTGAVSSIPNGYGKQFNDNLGYNIGLSISVPIFNGNKNKVNVNRAVINNERVTYDLEQAKQDLFSTIENAYLDAKAALNQYQASEVSLTAQQEAFRTAKESYNNGVMTSFEFQQVQNRLINAQSSLANAKFNFVFKTKLLEFYNGIPITLD
ncbi:transporter [Pseudalgibacter alginicilyticus]|uniref:Transporter n=1 Tax=Pseudalgibacter alginicilyticus TaxID=1736674 RepID=A0A0P0CQW4_9FLAO|nr:TolC family protein [Pseudalgibacter alginicilyticus]ALJ06845.1 transporter [Pseudalgibacter alginicilyticus]